MRPLLCILQYPNSTYTVREIGFKLLYLVFQTMTVSAHIYIFLKNPSRFPPHSPSNFQCNSHRRNIICLFRHPLPFLLFCSKYIKKCISCFFRFIVTVQLCYYSQGNTSPDCSAKLWRRFCKRYLLKLFFSFGNHLLLFHRNQI